LRSVPYDENGEVLGDVILEFLNYADDFRDVALEILEKYEIRNPKRGEWYSLKPWLKAFGEISEKMGPTTLHILGTRISENMNWSPEIDSFQKGLDSLNVIYHSNHRGAKIGNYRLLSHDSEKREVKILCDTPYPCDFERGVITSIVFRVRPLDAGKIWVVHEDLRSCRKKGANSCTYLIKW